MKRLILIFIGIGLSHSTLLPFSKQQKSEFTTIVRTVDPHVNIGIYITSPGQPEKLYTKHKDRLFTPASCTKLFTAAAALHILGPDFRFKTKLLTDGQRIKNSLEGNLYLKASGDPTLTYKRLETLFSQLKKAKINHINGDICIDLSIFDECTTEYFGKGFCMDDIGELYNVATSALIIDRNCITLSYGKTIPLSDPHHNIVLIMKNLLSQLNIPYDGTIRITPLAHKPLKIIAYDQSQPLKELVAHLLKVSDNLYANALFKKLGAHTFNTGTWKTGKQALKQFLEKEIGIDPDTLAIEDGAGLSVYNLISPAQIVQLLSWIYNQPQLYALFKESLALSGTDGTLKTRLIQHPGIIKAKTGTLGRVSTIAGYLDDGKNPPLIFAIMLNNILQAQYASNEQEKKKRNNYKTDIEDALCIAMLQNLAPTA